MKIARRHRVSAVLATASVAVGSGVAAAPASADHSCVHSINQAIQDRFGSKAALVDVINDRFNTEFNVGDLNRFIGRVCDGDFE